MFLDKPLERKHQYLIPYIVHEFYIDFQIIPDYLYNVKKKRKMCSTCKL